jgi:cytochrome c peroxidase
MSALLFTAGVAGLASVCAAQPFDWGLPPGFPSPAVPADNPMSAARVELGRQLFHDTRMSINGTRSCATCHRQELAFTGGRARSKGATGAVRPRSRMSLINAAFAPSLTWADPMLVDFGHQAPVPMFGTDPVEMGLKGHERRLLQDLRGAGACQRLFARAFDGDPRSFSVANIARALAAFQRILAPARSPYDRYRYGGDPSAISEAARGREQFFFSGEGAGCFQCHGGWTFAGPVRHAGRPVMETGFHNTGLSERYPKPNSGLDRHTGNPAGAGKFRAPSLRNSGVAAPCMHDGGIATLEEVIENDAAGGRARTNPNRSSLLRPLKLTAGEKADLIALLHSLTGHESLRDPRWGNPRPARPGASAAPQSFCSITSVDLMTAVTVSPFFNPSSSALRRVITLSMTFFPTRTLTWAMTSPSCTSMIFPVNRFLADNGIPGFYHSSTPHGKQIRADVLIPSKVIP